MSVVTSKGKKQVGAISSYERGELVTVVYTVSAIGSVIPPLLIFPRIRYRDFFTHGGPTECIGQSNRSGWINEEIFCEYLEHVVKHTKCSIDRKILLIMDNHDSHISIKAVDTAKEHGIVLLTIPPHTSHRLQPLDRSVYGPFKKAYNRAIDEWLHSNPGKAVNIYNIPALVKQAQMKAFTPENIMAGFKATGICPYNRYIFTEQDFAPAIPTDREQPSDNNVDVEISNTQDVIANERTEEGSGESAIVSSGEIVVQPLTTPAPQASWTSEMSFVQGTSASRQPEDAPPVQGYVSPSAVHPFPIAKPKKFTSARRKGTTRILTDSPIRQELFELDDNRKKKLTKKTHVKPKPKKLKLPSTDHEQVDESDSDSNEEVIDGDFVIVKCCGRSRFVNFVAQIDAIKGEQYKILFLQKLVGKVGDTPIFTLNPNDISLIAKDEIVRKLPEPVRVGSSNRCQLVFKDCDLTGV